MFPILLGYLSWMVLLFFVIPAGLSSSMQIRPTQTAWDLRRGTSCYISVCTVHKLKTKTWPTSIRIDICWHILSLEKKFFCLLLKKKVSIKFVSISFVIVHANWNFCRKGTFSLELWASDHLTLSSKDVDA